MQLNLKVKNLIFDIGGVIILRDEIGSFKFDREFSLKEGTIENIAKTCFKKKSVDRNFNEKSFFHENFSHILSWTDYQGILERVYKAERLNKELLSWIKKNKKKYKISILTNNTITIDILLREKFKIHHLFDYVFVSGEIGLVKPDPKIFEYVLKKLKAKPEECLFVDDNSENIKSAEKLGFYTILFTNNKDFFEKLK